MKNTLILIAVVIIAIVVILVSTTSSDAFTLYEGCNHCHCSNFGIQVTLAKQSLEGSGL